jgi:hypothetical protein
MCSLPRRNGDTTSWMWIHCLTDLDQAGHYSWGSAVLAFLYRQLCEACRRSSQSPVRYALRSIQVVHISQSHGSTHVLSPFEKRVALDLKIPCRTNFIKFDYFINRYKNICIVLHRLYYSIHPPYQIINLF